MHILIHIDRVNHQIEFKSLFDKISTTICTLNIWKS